ncbi:hypothetical protein [Cetobacterium sp.]|uniref:hypothetical protein n=1 Tax=Cetobacterium sp. TaxID=2071632 RepID=UPI003EE784FE
MNNLNLQREFAIKKKKYQESFDRIRLFKKIKKHVDEIIEQVEIDYKKGNYSSHHEFKYINTFQGEFRVFEREIIKKIHKINKNIGVICFDTKSIDGTRVFRVRVWFDY